MSSLKIFISYSHKSDDEKCKERLRIHLDVLKSQNQVEVWEDRQLKSGDLWLEEIRKRLEWANIAIFLVSADSLTSEFILNEELPELIKAARFIPIVIKPCAWKSVPLLKKYQGHTKENAPLLAFDPIEQERVFADLADELYRRYIESKDILVNNGKSEKTKKVSHIVLPEPTPIDELNDIRGQVIDHLVQSIEKADLPCLTKRLAYHLKLDSDSGKELAVSVATSLLDMGFFQTNKGCLFNTCSDYLPRKNENIKVVEHLKRELTPEEVTRFKRAINEISTLLTIFELNDAELVKHCVQYGKNHFHIEGISTEFGAEIILRRMGISDVLTPDITPCRDRVFHLGGKISLERESIEKWSNEDNEEQAVIDVLNIVNGYMFSANNKPVRHKNDYLSASEKRMLNSDIKRCMKDEGSNRCFFIPYDFNDEQEVCQLYLKVKKQLPDLVILAFEYSDSVFIFSKDSDEIEGDDDIASYLKYLYVEFNLFDDL